MLNAILSPFTTVRRRDGELVAKSLFHSTELRLAEATPAKMREAGIAFSRGEWSSTLEGYFQKLEAQFRASKPTIGYIETTSKCPFTCIMCPKSKNELKRKDAVMSLELFEKILGQLRHQRIVTLHLFGDPLMDPHLFERLGLCRRYDLKPIFSTNIPLFRRKDIDRLFETPIEEMIVSVDSLDPRTYTKIRRSPGNREDRHGETLAPFFAFLEKFKSREHGVQRLTLRAVQLKLNQNDRDKIDALVDGDPRITVDIKPFINFPKTDRPELGQETSASLVEPVFVYQAMGHKLPFKCTKPWKAGELAVTSDGDVVPCCLCFNGPYTLGSLRENSLEELYFSDSYADFRRKIFFSSLNPEWLCSSCESDAVRFTLRSEDSEILAKAFSEDNAELA